MDSVDLQAISPCINEKGKCQWWDAMVGKCKIKSDIKCPQGVRKPRQEVMETDYRII